MACGSDCSLCVSTFVESGVVHDNDTGLCCTKTFVGGSGMDSLNKINVLAARPEESFKQLAH